MNKRMVGKTLKKILNPHGLKYHKGTLQCASWLAERISEQLKQDDSETLEQDVQDLRTMIGDIIHKLQKCDEQLAFAMSEDEE